MAASALCAHQRPAGLSTPLGAGGVRDTHRAVVGVVEGDAHKPVGVESKSRQSEAENLAQAVIFFSNQKI